MDAARLGGYDVVLLDTAGRIHIDEELMQESAEIRDIAHPHETLLVADASPARTRSSSPRASTSASASPASC